MNAMPSSLLIAGIVALAVLLYLVVVLLRPERF
jgi:K+-transporting ATPase KdpF subunit